MDPIARVKDSWHAYHYTISDNYILFFSLSLFFIHRLKRVILHLKGNGERKITLKAMMTILK